MLSPALKRSGKDSMTSGVIQSSPRARDCAPRRDPFQASAGVVGGGDRLQEAEELEQKIGMCAAAQFFLQQLAIYAFEILVFFDF